MEELHSESVNNNIDDELLEAFKLFDDNNDGIISLEELKQLVDKVGGDMTEGQVQAIMSLADRDNNGAIDFQEFQHLWDMVIGEDEVNILYRVSKNIRSKSVLKFKSFDGRWNDLIWKYFRKRMTSEMNSRDLTWIMMVISPKVNILTIICPI